MTDSLPVPPPPPSSDRRITAVLATGAAAFVAGLLWPGANDPAGWIGAALLIHGGDAWLRRRGQAALAQRLLGGLGGPIVPAVAGGYGLLTLARFVQLQAEDALLALLDPAAWIARLLELSPNVLFGYGRLSIDHAVQAFIWPVHLMSWVGPIGLGLGFAVGGWLWNRAQLRVPKDPSPPPAPPPAPPPG